MFSTSVHGSILFFIFVNMLTQFKTTTQNSSLKRSVYHIQNVGKSEWQESSDLLTPVV